MSCFIEYAYKNRNNAIDLLLKADDDDGVQSSVDLSSVTRMVIIDADGSSLVDEQTYPNAFDRDTGIIGKVVLLLGATSIVVGNYIARIVVYDPDNTSGIVWGNEGFNLVVK
jgi:hypothetical protein